MSNSLSVINVLLWHEQRDIIIFFIKIKLKKIEGRIISRLAVSVKSEHSPIGVSILHQKDKSAGYRSFSLKWGN